MSIAGLALDLTNKNPIILLRDPSGRRQVPILIDHTQAQNILAGFKKGKSLRLLSHDLMIDLLNAGSLSLERVIIHAIEESTFQAILKLRLKNNKSNNPKNIEKKPLPIEIDARPSDAIALAVRANCSIWMYENVVAECSIPVDIDADQEDQNEFKRFLETVQPEDLVRHLQKRKGVDKDQLEQNDRNNNSK